MKPYEPELGQYCFGSRWSEYDCPDYIEALLRYLGDELDRVMRNKGQKHYDSPLGNNGGYYKNDTFEMRAYCWGEHEEGNADCPCCLPNFKCGDFEVRWYKYCGRGMSIGREITESEVIKIFDKCISSLRKIDEQTLKELGL